MWEGVCSVGAGGSGVQLECTTRWHQKKYNKELLCIIHLRGGIKSKDYSFYLHA